MAVTVAATLYLSMVFFFFNGIIIIIHQSRLESYQITALKHRALVYTGKMLTLFPDVASFLSFFRPFDNHLIYLN
jgi:hypothetical protein